MPDWLVKIIAIFKKLGRKRPIIFLTIYAASVYPILHVSEIVFSAFKMPEWTIQFVILLVLLGAIITLISSLLFSKKENTISKIILPTGWEPDKLSNPKKKSFSKTILLLLISIVILFGGIYFFKILFPTQTEPSISVAILPFEEIGEIDKELNLATGITEEITHKLSRIELLETISWRSARRFKNSLQPLSKIGKELGVKKLVVGSIQKSNSQIKVRVQIIDAFSGKQDWAEEIDGNIENIFNIQSQIALHVLRGFHIKIGENQENQIKTPPTVNYEAFANYVKGNMIADNYASDLFGDSSAIKYFEAAVQIDSTFTLAWCKLANHHLFMYFLTTDVSHRRIELAKNAINKAISLAPNQPEVITSQGYYQYYGLRNYDSATYYFSKALKLANTNSEVLTALSLVKRRMGKWKEAVELLNRAYQLSPKDVFILHYKVIYNLCLANYDSAGYYNEIRKDLLKDYSYYQNKIKLALIISGDTSTAHKLILDGEKEFGASHFVTERLALYALQSNVEKIEEIVNRYVPKNQKYIKILDQYFSYDASIGQALKMYAGNTKKAIYHLKRAKLTFEDLYKVDSNNYTICIILAWTYACLGDKENAIKTIKRTFAIRPLYKDALEGIEPHLIYVIILTQLGEWDQVINELRFLQKIPGLYFNQTVYFIFKNDPIYLPLLGNTKFEELFEGNHLKQNFNYLY